MISSPLNWISPILNMMQHISANGADGETPCKTIDVRNKYIVVCQQSKPPFKVSRLPRVILVGVGSSNIFNFDLQIREQNAGLGGTWFDNRCPRYAWDIPSHNYSVQPSLFLTTPRMNSRQVPFGKICSTVYQA